MGDTFIHLLLKNSKTIRSEGFVNVELFFCSSHQIMLLTFMYEMTHSWLARGFKVPFKILGPPRYLGPPIKVEVLVPPNIGPPKYTAKGEGPP